jgi:hypothetical protein
LYHCDDFDVTPVPSINADAAVLTTVDHQSSESGDGEIANLANLDVVVPVVAAAIVHEAAGAIALCSDGRGDGECGGSGEAEATELRAAAAHGGDSSRRS